MVFDADPEELGADISLLAARPDDEPVWISLQQILVTTIASVCEQIVVQHHLLQRNPALASSGRCRGDHRVPILGSHRRRTTATQSDHRSLRYRLRRLFRSGPLQADTKLNALSRPQGCA